MFSFLVEDNDTKSINSDKSDQTGTSQRVLSEVWGKRKKFTCCWGKKEQCEFQGEYIDTK